MKECPCCGNFTIKKEYDICEVCYWEKEEGNELYPDKIVGANKVSLNQARENYKKCGACKEAFVPFVRNPKQDEKKINIKKKKNG